MTEANSRVVLEGMARHNSDPDGWRGAEFLDVANKAPEADFVTVLFYFILSCL